MFVRDCGFDIWNLINLNSMSRTSSMQFSIEEQINFNKISLATHKLIHCISKDVLS